MKKLLQKFKKNKKGFTLIELIIVIAIIAMLVGVLAPQYLKYVEKSRVSADLSTLDSVESAVKVALSDPDYDFAIPDAGIKVTVNGKSVTFDSNPVSTGTKTDKLSVAVKDNLQGATEDKDKDKGTITLEQGLKSKTYGGTHHAEATVNKDGGFEDWQAK